MTATISFHDGGWYHHHDWYLLDIRIEITAIYFAYRSSSSPDLVSIVVAQRSDPVAKGYSSAP
jgi:type IV secretory pathway TrbL component